MSWKTKTLSALIGAALVIAAAQAADFRTRAHAEADTQSDRIGDIEAEIDFGREVAAHILGRAPLSQDKALNEYVNRVGKAVAAHSNRPELDFRFAVIESDQVNAYAAPGGYIFITTGALALMKDEAELAGVLAHEVAHVVERHIVDELNIAASGDSIINGASRFIGGAGDPARVAFLQAVEKAMEILFESGLKKDDELEADRVGAGLLAHTGYDPSALKRYLERLRAHQRPEAFAVLSHTHPSFDERLSQLEAEMVKQGLSELKRPTLEDRFNRHVAKKQ